MNTDNNNEPLEIVAPSAVMAMEKASIDIQVATAHQYPRSLELFRKRALSMACVDAETAESCIYVRPVGKEKNDRGQWVEKYAEGPSIRLAEIVAVSYGNIRAAVKVVEQTERYVKCVGMAHDLETNTAVQADCVESTVTRDGTPYSERQRTLISKVCGAKALRDAIFKVVPRALCKPIMEAAKKVASGADKPLEERRKKAQAWVGTLRIDESRVFAALDVVGWADVTAEHLNTITGLKNAMADGDLKIDEAFPRIETEATKTQAHKPVQTLHQQATQATQQATKTPAQPQPVHKQDKGEDNVPMEGKTPLAEKPPKTPQDVPAAITTPSGQETSATAPATEQQPSESETEALPEQPPETIQEAGPATNREPDPELADKANDNDAMKNIKYLARESGVTSRQITLFCQSKKLARADQSWMDLSASKLISLGKAWAGNVAEIAKL